MAEEAEVLPFVAEAERPTFDARAAGARCDVCPIRKPNPVGPATVTNRDRKVRLVIVGEAPGRYEETLGKPFCGPNGKLLDRVLMEKDIDRRYCHMTNAMLCRPESEDQIPGAQYACSRRLFRELKAIDAKAPIVALGKEAARVLLGVKTILKARGFLWHVPGLREGETRKSLRRARARARVKKKMATVYNTTLKLRRTWIAGRVVFPTLHPAFILHSEIWSPVFDIDMDRVARYMIRGKLTLEDEQPFLIVSSADELRKVMRRFRKQDVTVDIETDGPDPLEAKMLCVGLGNAGEKRRVVVAYPWTNDMAPVLQELFDGGATLVGHNVITFDCIVLERYGISVGILDKASQVDRVQDTLVAHHSFASHLPKSLAHCASVFCDAQPWKIVAKGGGGKSEKGQLPHQLSPEELTKYNAADVSLTALVWERCQIDLADEWAVYNETKRLGALCARMRWKGFAFDMRFAKDLYRKLQARKQNLLWEMRDLIGDDEFKPSRAFDLRQVLFGRLKVPLIYPTKSGLPATSRVVLEQLRHGNDMAGRISDLVLRWRDCHKTQSTYLSVPIGRDGRVHADWRIGPVSGRLASRIMTLPRFTKAKEDTAWCKKDEVDITDQVRACYIAPPGRVLIYFDLSQAEMRFAANLSGDPVFIEACKGDVHAGNARVLFPAEEKQGFFATDAEAKDGRGKPFRDIAKNAGFAVTYLAEADTVYVYLSSHGFPSSLPEVRAMLDRLHIAYKGYFDYVAENVKFVQKHGYLRSAVSGRIRYFGHTPKPTEVANFPVQTGIADLMNVRLLDVEARLPDSAFVIAQVHDAAIIEADLKDVESIKQIIHDVYDPPILLPDRAPFVVPVDLKVARRWSEL
jgi:uracil-DNA glycosylase family 4